MQTKNAAAITDIERRHMQRVKELPCSLCDAPGPSEAHHIRQGAHFTTVALCADCHRGSLGLHGQKTLMRVKKADELDLLNITLSRLTRWAC